MASSSTQTTPTPQGSFSSAFASTTVSTYITASTTGAVLLELTKLQYTCFELVKGSPDLQSKIKTLFIASWRQKVFPALRSSDIYPRLFTCYEIAKTACETLLADHNIELGELQDPDPSEMDVIAIAGGKLSNLDALTELPKILALIEKRSAKALPELHRDIKNLFNAVVDITLPRMLKGGEPIAELLKSTVHAVTILFEKYGEPIIGARDHDTTANVVDTGPKSSLEEVAVPFVPSGSSPTETPGRLQGDSGKRKCGSFGVDDNREDDLFEPTERRIQSTANTVAAESALTSINALEEQEKNHGDTTSALSTAPPSSQIGISEHENPFFADKITEPLNDYLPTFPHFTLYVGIPYLYQGFQVGVRTIEALQTEQPTASLYELAQRAEALQSVEEVTHEVRSQLKQEGKVWATACMLSAAAKKPHTTITHILEAVKEHGRAEFSNLYDRMVDEYLEKCTEVGMVYFEAPSELKHAKHSTVSDMARSVKDRFLDLVTALEGMWPFLNKT
ncbi:hypothetical protein BDV96DRAFT_594797 [Lophiotrema nucula]|uniref:Uncharacterized protein n=1 Tax=Lophiotrema nucula TaxID=690887 RepID=A0A6A5ZRY1_9PLEO|nr:hypothetical protein BDV96DRAFT_594797 [Lophiotrema nucula]